MAAHDELVTAGSFIEKFQKPVRDYFCYGFKEFSGRQYMQNGKAVPSESKQKEDYSIDPGCAGTMAGKPASE